MGANANARFDLQQLAALFAYIEPALAGHLADCPTFGVRTRRAIDRAKAHCRDRDDDTWQFWQRIVRQLSDGG
jgi:hypothetical protein